MLSYFSIAHNQQLYAHAQKNGFTISSCHHIHHWLVVWNMIFIFPCIGNHPPDWLSYFSEGQVHHQPVAIMLYLHYDTFDTVKNDVYIIYIYIYLCIYMHWSYSSSFHHLISMSEASAGNQATTCSIHRWGPPGQPGIAGSKKWGTQRISKVYSSIPWESSMCLWYANRCMIIGIQDMFMK